MSVKKMLCLFGCALLCVSLAGSPAFAANLATKSKKESGYVKKKENGTHKKAAVTKKSKASAKKTATHKKQVAYAKKTVHKKAAIAD